MSIFSSILAKIFPSNHPAVTGDATAAAGGTAPSASPPPTSVTSAATVPAPASGSGSTAPEMSQVDVEQVLNAMAAKSSEKLNWRTSIVDLMKLLGLDSSLTARKTLAGELHYSGDTNDSATMNVWLHRQVMTRLAQNGGKVPAELQG